MKIDFSNWAVVAFNDNTGLGTMARDIRAVLGMRQLAVPSERLNSSTTSTDGSVVGLDPKMTEDELEVILAPLQGVLLLERANWHPKLTSVCRKLGVRTVCVPMWEWFRGTDACWGEVDFFACPSEFCLGVVRKYGWKNSAVVTWPVDLTQLPKRVVRGHARTFFHNGGLMDHDDRKGTIDTIRAFLKLREKDVRLIVRLQKLDVSLPAIDERVEIRVGNLPSRSELYTEGEVAVQPSKMEGIGFGILEPVACGVPTVTLNHEPMSGYVRRSELLARMQPFKRTCFPRRAAGILHAYLRVPWRASLARRMSWCVRNDLADISSDNRGWAESEFNVKRLENEWARALGGL